MLDLDPFFREIDAALRGRLAAKIELRVLGSVALMLQTDYARGTRDGDVLETSSVTGETKDALLAVAGSGTRIHQRYGIYLDVVAGGLPFLPHGPMWHPLSDLNASLGTFSVAVLDVIDVVVSKLKRFHASDRADVQAMIDRDLVPHDRLVARFRSAVDVFSGDARAEELPRYVRNLHRVERDMFGAAASAIELPGWIEDD
jgi:hypothetical protein